MAKLRAASAYRRLKRAYTRRSKTRSKSYVKGVPHSKIVQFDMGQKTVKFPYEVQLVSRRAIQVRDNALEAARMTANRYMEIKCVKTGYAIKIRAVPHHVLRENPLATGAGADRFQRGMTLAFGKPYGLAAQVYKGKIILSIYVNKEDIPHAKEAARKAGAKMPMKCGIEIKKAK